MTTQTTQTTPTTLYVPEISCQHCVAAITQEVSALAGVTNVHVTLDTKTVQVAHDPTVTTAALVAAINEAGFDEVTPVQA